MKIVEENTTSKFDGTIIDLETIGNFERKFTDSRQYSKIRPVFFGYLTKNEIEIHCAENKSEIDELLSKIKRFVSKLPRPFYAFNTPFEMGVIFHNLGEEILFERELNKEKFEPKHMAVQELKLPNYDDPFFDIGRQFISSWEKGNIKNCIAHNRADLFKERDILLKRGFRKPDEFKFVEL